MDFLKISKALADNTRFHILKKIHERGEVFCTELTELFSISQPAVSHHLKVLTEAGLVVARKKGQHTFYRVNRDILEEYTSQLNRMFSKKAAKTKKPA